MICPKCEKVRLKQRRVKGKNLAVDVCPECGGIWFDPTEVERAMDRATEPLTIPRDADRSAARCPRCDVALSAFRYPQTAVTIDGCRQCGGFWLEAGEFQAIRKARQYLEEVGQAQEEAESGTVRARLLQFIDVAIARLLE